MPVPLNFFKIYLEIWNLDPDAQVKASEGMETCVYLEQAIEIVSTHIYV